MHATHPPPRRLVTVASCLACAVLLALGAPQRVEAAGERAAADPVQVFYPRGDCRGERIDLEVWDRDRSVWKRHPLHPRVPVESCQTEDAGVLLHEIRWRCVEPPDADPPAVWVVGLEVFDPEIMERCAVSPLRLTSGDSDIVVSNPPADRPFRSETPEAAVRGSVRMQGLEGAAYDVVVAVDRSTSVRDGDVDLLDAQLRAAGELVARLEARLGLVRVGIVSYPNAPPGPGESTGARREIGLTADRVALQAGLARLRRRGASGMQTFSSAFEFGLAELAGRNPGSGARERARKVLVIASDGRRALPFGAAAQGASAFRSRVLELADQAHRQGVAVHLLALGGLAEAPSEFVQSVVARCQGAFSRVPAPALGTAYLDALPLPTVEEVVVQNTTTGRPASRAAIDAEGRFEARLAFVGGANRLSIRARTSDGSWAQREWTVNFDDALVVERLRAAERERMQREQRKSLKIEPERARELP